MRDFDAIHALAAKRKGGEDALERLLSTPASPSELQESPDLEWLSAMAKCIFRAGFNWTVIENKWPAFSAAFEGFDPGRVAFYHDDDMDRLLADKGIVRNGAKITAVIENARFVRDVSEDEGSFGAFVARWPADDFVGLLAVLKERGSRLGGLTGQRVLRMMGRDGFLLSPDVTKRLVAEGVLDGPAASKRAMQKIQAAFDTWSEQSGRGLTQISQILAFSI